MWYIESFILNYIYIERGISMSKKVTATKMKMAAIGNNMIEVGKEIYIDPQKENKPNKSVRKESK
jgi:hypothetical protein